MTSEWLWPLPLGLLASAMSAPDWMSPRWPLAVADGEEPSLASLPWPEPEPWERALRQSALVADADSGDRRPLRPLVWDLDRLYLQRLWHDELQVASELRLRCQDVDQGAASGGSGLDEPSVEAILDSLFEGRGDGSGADGAVQEQPRTDRQRLATRRGLRHRVSIIAGGPGTGKTYTVARLLAASPPGRARRRSPALGGSGRAHGQGSQPHERSRGGCRRSIGGR